MKDEVLNLFAKMQSVSVNWKEDRTNLEKLNKRIRLLKIAVNNNQGKK